MISYCCNGFLLRDITGESLWRKISCEDSSNATIMSLGALRGASMNTVFLGGFMLHPIMMRY